MDKDFFNYLLDLKKSHGLKIIDTHIHPLDVMGVVHFIDYKKEGDIREAANYFKPGLMEKLKFGRLANFLSNNLFNLFTRTVVKEIKSLYNNAGERRVLEEMEGALADKVVFLSVEPWSDTFLIKEHFNNQKFLLLGSFDINRLKIDEIEPRLNRYIDELGIVGLKLHPNLQNFKPQPGDNPPEIAAKLKLIYRLAEKHKLYLLFHGGLSSFTEYTDEKYYDLRRSKDNARLENFCAADGASELFGQYNIPIVIAHLGHFGFNKINERLVKLISEKYGQVYFDTAAVSPRLISRFIELVGSQKIVLGSDALYNRMVYGIYFVYQAARSAKTKESFNEIICNILGENFNSKILKQ